MLLLLAFAMGVEFLGQVTDVSLLQVSGCGEWEGLETATVVVPDIPYICPE
jgi:hypothetical protein